MHLSILLLLLVGANYKATAQVKKADTRIIGSVLDSETGEAIIGANIMVEGTNHGCATDLEGKFSIVLPPGSYSVLVSAISHAKKRITDLHLESGKEVSIFVSLSPEAIKMNEVLVEARANTSFEAALLKKQKNSMVISDGISAEQIKRTPDATSGDALRRLTGISLVDNKFIFIRGVTDRYNQTTLNGTAVSSTDADKKGFSFDILPSSLLENTVVVKSATPDMRGDFTGGLVQLSTLDFPETRVVKVSVSSSFNSLTTSKHFNSSAGGSRDWLGMDDGRRSLPGSQNLDELGKRLPNTWAPHARTAPFNGSLALSYGDNIKFDRTDGQSDELGFVAALTYRNNFQHNDRTINDYALGRNSVGARDDFSVLWGALANISYKFDGMHKFSFRNNYNQTAEDQVGTFISEDQNTSLLNKFTVVNWNQRSIYSGQLSGEHNLFSLGGLFVEWRAAVSYSKREIPDRKEVTYSRPIDDATVPFAVAINQRSWSSLNDHTGTLGLDVQIPVTTAVKAKVGIQYERQKTDYRVRYFNVVPDYMGGIPRSLTTAGLETVYDPANFGAGKFILQESSKASDSYDANSKLTAAYAMIDLPFKFVDEKFRFVGGARMENSSQNVRVPKTLAPDGPVDETTLQNSDILPSMNLTYFVNAVTNLRVSYSHSVNRPEFRELASTGFYDFIKYELVGGNPDLKRSLASNFDVRLELFLDPGELLAMSFFHKNIKGAIEEKLIQAATRTRTWFNSDEANNTGWEFEVRQSFAFIGDFWRRVSVTGNYTTVKSAVEVKQIIGNSTNTQTIVGTRPMQGQSPYIVNVSLLFTEPSTGTGVNMLYNKFGRRLDAVGFLAADIYEEPRDLMDLAVTQPVSWGLELKFAIKNLNNSERVLTRGAVLYEKTRTGRTYSLQLTKTF
jgi:hypothetical protein